METSEGKADDTVGEIFARLCTLSLAELQQIRDDAETNENTRKAVDMEWNVRIEAATKLQTAIRLHLSRMHLRACNIQRVYRGYRGRLKAYKQLLKDAWRSLEYGELQDSCFSDVTIALDTLQQAKQARADSKGQESNYNANAHRGRRESVSCAPALEYGAALTPEFVDKVVDYIHLTGDGCIVDEDTLIEVMRRLKPLLKKEPNLTQFDFQSDRVRLTLVGDLHGQINDLMTIFQMNGRPSEVNAYIFNGDFVDRGPSGVGIIFVLFLYKLLHPNTVFLNRGNHESRDINVRCGFEAEVKEKYPSGSRFLFNECQEVFARLPLGCLISSKALVVHGGLCASDNVTIKQIQAIDRFQEVPEHGGLMEDLLWSDPQLVDGCQPNPRGGGVMFGPDVCRAFLEQNDLMYLVRSHELTENGYESLFNDTCYTIFSCSNYTGAFARVKQDLSLQFLTYYVESDNQTAVRWKENPFRTELRQVVVGQLLERIAETRFPLFEWYCEHDSANTGLVSRVIWAQGLKSVLSLDKVYFLRLQSQLGLPILGADGQPRGPVNYQEYLKRFRPIHLGQLIEDDVYESEEEEMSDEDDFEDDLGEYGGRRKRASSMESIEYHMLLTKLNGLSEFMYIHRHRLRAIFHWLDVDGDGVIDHSELKEGLRMLVDVDDKRASKSLLKEEDIAEFMVFLDAHGNGGIRYSDFLSAFAFDDNKLDVQVKTMEQSQSMRLRRTTVHHQRETIMLKMQRASVRVSRRVDPAKRTPSAPTRKAPRIPVQENKEC